MIATTLPISFSDVCLELYGSTSTVGKSLSQAFTDATGVFDTTYDSINGYHNSLQNFRGYNHIANWLMYFLSTSGYSTVSSACSSSGIGSNYYSNRNGGNVVIGDKISQNISGTPLFNGGNLWYKDISAENRAIKINTLGTVIDIVSCI